MKDIMDSPGPPADSGADEPPAKISDDLGNTASADEPAKLLPEDALAANEASPPADAGVTDSPLISFESDVSPQVGGMDEMPLPEATDGPLDGKRMAPGSEDPEQEELQEKVRAMIRSRIPELVEKVRIAAATRINEIQIESEDVDSMVERDAVEIMKNFMMGAFQNGELKQQANAMMIAQRAILERMRRINAASALAAASSSQEVNRVALSSEAIADLSGSPALTSVVSEMIDTLATPTPGEEDIDMEDFADRVGDLDQQPAREMDLSSLSPSLQNAASMLGMMDPKPMDTADAVRAIAAGGAFPGADGPIDLEQMAMRDPFTLQRISGFADLLQGIMNEFAANQIASNAQEPPPSGTGQERPTAAMLLTAPKTDAKRAKNKAAENFGKKPAKGKGKGKANATAPDPTAPLDEGLEEWLRSWVAFRSDKNNRRIQPRPAEEGAGSDFPTEDLCAPTGNNRFVIDWRGRDNGREVPMPLKEEVEMEFPGKEHEHWRAWIEYIRTIHPDNGGQRSQLDNSMRDDLMYGQCDVPELRTASGAFTRNNKNGLIRYFKSAETGIWTPMRYPKANVLLGGGRVSGARDGKIYRRVQDFRGRPVLSYQNGAVMYAPTAAPGEQYRLAMEAARALRVGNFDGSNGLPTLVSAKTCRSRSYRDGYAVIVPIRLNKYHWEYQYARELANPLVEPASRTPVVPMWAYKTTDPELEGKVAPATYRSWTSPSNSAQPCTTNVALPMMPTRSMGDRRLRRDCHIFTQAKNKDESQEAVQARVDAARQEDNFLTELPTNSRPHDYVLSNAEGVAKLVRTDSTDGDATDPMKSGNLLVEVMNAGTNKQPVHKQMVEEAKKARRRMWFPHHLQNTVEYPLRSGGQAAVEFDTDPVTLNASTPVEEQRAPVFLEYPRKENDFKKRESVGPTYPTVHLWDSANKSQRFSHTMKPPRSAKYETNKWKKAIPPPEMLPPWDDAKQKYTNYSGISSNAPDLMKEAEEESKKAESTPGMKKDRRRGERLDPQWTAPLNLKDVMENFLEHHYDAFQYQHVRQDAKPHVVPMSNKFDLPARMPSTDGASPEQTMPSRFNSKHTLINRPLKGKLGKGGLKVSLRLDTGPGRGMGGLDSYLPIPGKWDLRTVVAKGTRGFHEIWANGMDSTTGPDGQQTLSARARRNGAPYWYKQELTSMARYPSCPWMENVRGGEGVLPAANDDDLYAHRPVEFLPPERIGLTSTLKGVLKQMRRNQEHPDIPEMGTERDVARANSADQPAQAAQPGGEAEPGDEPSDEEFEKALEDELARDAEEEEERDVDMDELGEDMAAAQEGATAEATGLFQTTDEALVAVVAPEAGNSAIDEDNDDEAIYEDDLFGWDDDEEDPEMAKRLQEAQDAIRNPINFGASADATGLALPQLGEGASTGAPAQNNDGDPSSTGSRNEDVLLFPLYVTFFDNDDFERARFQIDDEWNEFMSTHKAYYRWADRFRLELQSGTTDVYRLIEGEREYEDPATYHLTGKLSVAPYEIPQMSTVIRVEGAEECGDDNPYGFAGGFCIRPRERYEESWRRDRREFGRPREPLRTIYPASGSPPIEIGDRPEDPDPVDKFKTKVQNWTKAWTLRQQQLYGATMNQRSEEQFEQTAKLVRATSARLSWYEGIVRDVGHATFGETGRIQALYFAFCAAKNVVTLIEATTQTQEQASKLKMAHQTTSAEELQALAARHPLLAAIADQASLPWTVPTSLEIVTNLPNTSSFVFEQLKAIRNLPVHNQTYQAAEQKFVRDPRLSTLTNPVAEIEEIDCLGGELKATCAILEAVIDKELARVHGENRSVSPFEDQVLDRWLEGWVKRTRPPGGEWSEGGRDERFPDRKWFQGVAANGTETYELPDDEKKVLRNSAQAAMALKVADLKSNVVDNLEAGDLVQLAQLYASNDELKRNLHSGAGSHPFDVMRRHTSMAEAILSDPPLIHLVDTTIFAGWPAGVPRSMAERDRQGIIFMSVIDLVNPHTDDIELLNALLHYPSRFNRWIAGEDRVRKYNELVRRQLGYEDEAERAGIMTTITELRVGLSNEILRQQSALKVRGKFLVRAKVDLEVSKESASLPEGSTIYQLSDHVERTKAQYENLKDHIEMLKALRVRALSAFARLKTAVLSDATVQLECVTDRTLRKEFYKRISDPRLDSPANAQAVGYAPTCWRGEKHSGPHHKIPGVQSVGYIRISEAEILQGMGNYYDGISMANVMAFDGNEHYGPKGAYRRYVLQTAKEWIEYVNANGWPEDEEDKLPALPMTYRAWYQSPLHNPEKYAGVDTTTGAKGWPTRKHPGRRRDIGLTPLQKRQVRRGLYSEYDLVKNQAVPHLAGLEHVPRNNPAAGSANMRVSTKIDMGESIDARAFLIPHADDDVIPPHPDVLDSGYFTTEENPQYTERSTYLLRFPDDDVENLRNAYMSYRKLEAKELAHHCTTKDFKADTRFGREFTPFKLPYLFLFANELDAANDPRPYYFPEIVENVEDLPPLVPQPRPDSLPPMPTLPELPPAGQELPEVLEPEDPLLVDMLEELSDDDNIWKD